MNAQNPFSVSRVRPGALAYHFAPGLDSQTLIARLNAAGWRGQIVGPHGSGKSTLLVSLTAELARRGRPTVLVTLHDGQRRMPPGFFRRLPRLAPQGLVIVDGYEQLSWWSRRRLSWYCCHRRLGLVITTHKAVRLPIIYSTQPDPACVVQLATQLLGASYMTITENEVREGLERRAGNVRELFMDLYDRWEELLRSTTSDCGQ